MAIDYKEIFYNYLSPRAWCETDEEFIFYDLVQATSSSGAQNAYEIVYNLNKIIDIEQTPEKFIPWLATFVNFPIVTFANYFNWSIAKQRLILKWLYSNQRYTGTKKAIKEFVEEFIDGCLVEDIYEPWKNVFKLGVSKISGEDKIRDSTYYRDSTLRIYVSNANNTYLRTLLEWLSDPHIKIYITNINGSQSDSITTEFTAQSHITQFLYAQINPDEAIKVSDYGEISGRGYISGKTTTVWPSNAQSHYGILDEMMPLADSIWRLDELAVRTENLREPIIPSGSESISMGPVIGGSSLITYEMPTVDEAWDYFGELEQHLVES